MTIQLPKAVKCIIFDLDGTLADFEQRVHAAYLTAFLAIGSEKSKIWTIDDTRAQNGRDKNEIFADMSIWHSAEFDDVNVGAVAGHAFYAAYNAQPNFRPELCQESLFDGAIEALQATRMDGVRVVLLGAKTEEILKKEAEVLGIAPYFDAIYGATEDSAQNKPNPGVFDRAVAGLTITDTKQVIHIGDNPNKDNAFAEKWGATSVIVQPKEDKTALRSLANAFETTYPCVNRKPAIGLNVDSSHTKG